MTALDMTDLNVGINAQSVIGLTCIGYMKFGHWVKENGVKKRLLVKK
jgi:hypothetical protein